MTATQPLKPPPEPADKPQLVSTRLPIPLGLAFYGAAAIAYDRVGINEKPEVYDQIAAEECAKMEAALRAVAVEDEPNPAKINWNC